MPFASVFETAHPVVMMLAVCKREVELPADCPRQAVLRRALAKESSQRFSSCMEFIESAAKVQSRRTIPFWVPIVSVLVLLLAAVGGIVFWHDQRQRLAAERQIEEAKGDGSYVLEPTAAKTNDSADAAPNVEYKFSYKLDKDGTAVITGVDPKPVGTVVIPEKIDGHLVTAFEEHPSPFDGCDGVTKVVLPAGMKEGNYLGVVLSECRSLSSIEVSNANKYLASHDGVLYSKDFSMLFVYPKTRESVKLSPKTEEVRRHAFRCSALKTAKIPDGIEHVASWNFCGCPDLEVIELPKSLKFLGLCVVCDDGKLKKIVFNGDAPQVGM